MRRRLAVGLIAAGLAIAGPGLAQVAEPFDASVAPPEEILRLAGAWTLSTEDGEHSCRIVLTPRRIPAGYAINLPEPCTDPVLYMEEVAAWWINPESLQLVTVTGASVSTFFPGDERLYTQTDPVLILKSSDKQGEGAL